MRNIFKQKKGITLIALVITIIVLLILAGISISMLSGDNSILKKATDTKTNSEKQSIIEQARIDILGQQAENKGTNITKEQLATILNKYFTTTETDSIPNEISSEHDLELTTIDNKYKINLSEIYIGVINVKENNKKMITFKFIISGLDDLELTCEEGLTWEEWAKQTAEPVYYPHRKFESSKFFNF